MKLIVDFLPKRPEECLLSEYDDDGLFKCKVDSSTPCRLCSGKECICLLPLKGIGQTIKRDKV